MTANARAPRQLDNIETDERICGLRHAEHVPGREDDVLLHAASRDLGGIESVGQPAPEIEAAARNDPRDDAEGRQPINRLLPGSRQTLPQLLHVLSIAAASENAGVQLGREGARHRVRVAVPFGKAMGGKLAPVT